MKLSKVYVMEYNINIGVSQQTILTTTVKEAIKVLAPELHLSVEELTEIMNRNVYSMDVDDSYIKGSNGTAVGEYLKSVGNIKTVPEFASYNDFSLLKDVDASLVKAVVNNNNTMGT